MYVFTSWFFSFVGLFNLEDGHWNQVSRLTSPECESGWNWGCHQRPPAAWWHQIPGGLVVKSNSNRSPERHTCQYFLKSATRGRWCWEFCFILVLTLWYHILMQDKIRSSSFVPGNLASCFYMHPLAVDTPRVLLMWPILKLQIQQGYHISSDHNCHIATTDLSQCAMLSACCHITKQQSFLLTAVLQRSCYNPAVDKSSCRIESER